MLAPINRQFFVLSTSVGLTQAGPNYGGLLPPNYPALLNLPFMSDLPRGPGMLVETWLTCFAPCWLLPSSSNVWVLERAEITTVEPRVRQDDPPPVQLMPPTARSVPCLCPPSLPVCYSPGSSQWSAVRLSSLRQVSCLCWFVFKVDWQAWYRLRMHAWPLGLLAYLAEWCVPVLSTPAIVCQYLNVSDCQYFYVTKINYKLN